MRVGPALPPEVPAALEMLFAHLPAQDAAERISAARLLLQAGVDQPVQLLLAREDEAVVGAALMQVLAGATGVIWPPRGATTEIENALVRKSLAWLRSHGAKLAQSILAGPDAFLGDALVRNGFQHPTPLCYLL